MRFFLYLNPQTSGPEADSKIIDDITRQAIEADEAGFCAVLLTEHHFNDYNTYGNPFMYGSYLAPQLKNAYIILTVAVAPLHDPVRLAEQCNVLDTLTRGKTVIAFGPGGSPVEFGGFGRNPQERHELMEEVVGVVKQLWAHNPEDPPLEYKTRYSNGRVALRIMPSSYRKPHPLIGRATLTDATLVKTGEQGIPVYFGRAPASELGRRWKLYWDAVETAGHSMEIVQQCRDLSAVQKMVYVAESDKQALLDLETPLRNLDLIGQKAFPADMINRGPDPRGVAADDKQAFLESAAIFGSPDTVARKIQEHAEQVIPNLATWLSFGFMEPEYTRHSQQLFINEVMPRFSQNLVTR